MDNQETLLAEDRFQIEKYWKIIKPRLYIVIIIPLLLVAAAYIKVSTKVPVYQASGLLMIEPETTNVITFDNRAAFTSFRNEYFNTQIEILQSRSLAKLVKKEFDFTYARNLESKDDKSFSMSGPIVEPLEFTHLVKVSYRSTDPAAAAELVNLLFNNFIDFYLDLKTKSSKEAAKYINKQIAKLQSNLQEKEREMQAYGQSKELFNVSKDDSAVVEKFSDLNKAYTDAQIDRINKEAYYQGLKSMSYENFPQVKESALIESLKNTNSSLEADYRKKSQLFKPDYPEMQKLRSQIETNQRRIQQETRDVAMKALKEAESEYQAAQKKEESLLNLLEKQKGVMVASNADAIYYKALGIEVDNMRSLFNYLTRKHRESELSSRFEGMQTINIKVIDPAEIPKKPIASGITRTLTMALMLGLALGFGLIFFLDYMDRSLKTPDEVRTILRIPALGVIPSSNSKAVSRYYSPYYKDYGYRSRDGDQKKENPPKSKQIELINFAEPESPFSEHYRTIRTSILLSSPKEPPRVISISSALPAEGKTATTINLAISFSQLRKRVLIIDGDMRKPRSHNVFKLKNNVGLSSYLVGSAKLADTLQKTHIPDLFLLPSGPIPPNPSELIDSEIMPALLQKLREKVDFIFIDSPPLIGIVDPILLGKHADGLLLVTWAGKTNRNVVEKAKEELDRFNVRTLGVVLNRAAARRREYGYDYSYYHYRYRYKEGEPESEKAGTV